MIKTTALCLQFYRACDFVGLGARPAVDGPNFCQRTHFSRAVRIHAGANDLRNCLTRLEAMYLAAGTTLPVTLIRAQIATALDVIVHVSRLRDGSGKLAVANLSGTNTLRLTVAGTDDGPTRYVMSLQYLAFVPALLVESAAKVSGPYSIEPNASVEPGTRQITLPRSGGTRFYRLRWDHAVRIARIALAGGNVLLTYQ